MGDIWLQWYSAAEVSDCIIYSCGTWIVYFLFYYLHSWVFICADWYGFLDKYAIRAGNRYLPPLVQQYEAIREASIDTFIIKPILLFSTFPLLGGPFLSFNTALPSVTEAIWQILLMLTIFATSLFWIHLALHKVTWLYKNVHKKHHEFHETVGFAAQFHHPIEALASTLHVVLGVVLVRPHVVVYLIVLCFTLIEIVDSHCGYDVPWKVIYVWSDVYPWGSGARAHDFHHSHNIGVYGGGLLGLWDEFMQTNQAFKNCEKKRIGGRK